MILYLAYRLLSRKFRKQTADQISVLEEMAVKTTNHHQFKHIYGLAEIHRSSLHAIKLVDRVLVALDVVFTIITITLLNIFL